MWKESKSTDESDLYCSALVKNVTAAWKTRKGVKVRFSLYGLIIPLLLSVGIGTLWGTFPIGFYDGEIATQTSYILSTAPIHCSRV